MVVPEYYAIHRGSGNGHLRLSGSLDIGAREDVVAGIVAAVDQGAPAIVVDLGDVAFLDSEALGGLIQGYHAARQAGVTFRVVGARGIVHRVLAVTGTLELFTPADNT